MPGKYKRKAERARRDILVRRDKTADDPSYLKGVAQQLQQFFYLIRRHTHTNLAKKHMCVRLNIN